MSGSETYAAERGAWSAEGAQSGKSAKIHERMLRDYKLAYNHPDWKEIRDQAEKDDRALSISGPWTDEERNARNTRGQERPCLHLDQLSQYVHALENEARSNPIGIKVDPSGGQATEQVAKLRADRIRAIEYESNATSARMTAFLDMIRHGWGVYAIDVEYRAWDDFRQVIRYKECLNSYAYLWDPNADLKDWSDMKFWFDLYRMGKDEFGKKYPDATESDIAKDLIDLGWADDEAVQVARYWYVTKEKRNVYNVQSPMGPVKVIREKMKDGIKLPDGSTVTLEGFKLTDESLTLKDGTVWPVQAHKVDYEPIIYYCIVSGSEVLEEPEVWSGKWIPRFPLVGKQYYERHNQHARRVIESRIRHGRDGQMLFDYYASTEAEMVSATSKTPYIGFEGQFEGHEDEWATAHKVPRGYLEAKAHTEEIQDGVLPLPAKQQFEPPIQATEIGKESTRRSIQAAIGSYGVTRLDDTNVKSGVALERLKAQNDMGSFHFLDALKTVIMHDGRVVNDLLDNVETEEMEVGLKDVNDQYSVKRINTEGEQSNPEQPSTYRLTDEDQFQVTISVGKPYQSQREEDAEVADTLFTNIDRIANVVGPEVAKQMVGTALKLRQLGPDMDQIVKQLLPDNRNAPDPKALIAQMEQTMKLAETLGQQVQELKLEREAKLVDIESRENIARMQAEIDLAKAEISTKAQIASERAAFVEDLIRQFQLQQHETASNEAQRQHERETVAQQQAATNQQSSTIEE